ncbi:MAG: NfeD family protein [Caldilineaceae bacterium]|nr:NfeD family protein [Caldilineaceae bacterium]
MENWLSWAWFVLALLFTIAEIFTSGFFLVCFGAGAAVAAVAGFLGFSPLAQFAVFIGASGLALFLVRPFANRVSNPNTHMVGIDRVLGREGIVLETIDPARGSGVVRVGHEPWSADAADGMPIAAGVMVQVVGVEGTHLKVRVAV